MKCDNESPSYNSLFNALQNRLGEKLDNPSISRNMARFETPWQIATLFVCAALVSVGLISFLRAEAQSRYGDGEETSNIDNRHPNTEAVDRTNLQRPGIVEETSSDSSGTFSISRVKSALQSLFQAEHRHDLRFYANEACESSLSFLSGRDRWMNKRSAENGLSPPPLTNR